MIRPAQEIYDCSLYLISSNLFLVGANQVTVEIMVSYRYTVYLERPLWLVNSLLVSPLHWPLVPFDILFKKQEKRNQAQSVL